MKKSLIIALAVVFGALGAAASYISLNTTLSSKVEGKNLKIMVSTVNKGDESAYNVQAELRVGGKDVLTEKRMELPVDSSYQARATIPIPFAKPGTYPLVLVLHYTDANQYPFSALSCQTFVYKKETLAPLFGRVRSIVFSKEGKLSFELKNLTGREIKAKIYFVVPAELTVADEKQEFIIGPKSEKSPSFSVKNFSALSGSTYQVFAVSEFEDKGLHYTSIAPGTVKIVEERSFLGLGQNVIIIILAALVIIFAGAQFIKKK